MLPLIASVAGTKLQDDEKYWLEMNKPAGVIFFARNIENKEQLQKLITDIKNAVGNDRLILAVDQEGGRVRRLREPDFASYASQYVIGQAGTEAARLHAGLISRDLQSVGMNFNCSPVLDILRPETSDVIGSRSFGKDEKVVAALGQIMVDVFCQNGICPCIKHLPGHGRATVDSHLALPVVNNSLSELETDFFPFIANNSAPAAMTAHIVLTAVDDKLPVTLSKKAVDTLIRGKIAFNGLLLSDAIEMKALGGTIAERGMGVLNAGCDLICYCSGKIEDLYSLSETCPPVSEQTMRRLEKVWQIIDKQPPFAEYERPVYDRLVGEITAYRENYDATAVLELLQNK